MSSVTRPRGPLPARVYWRRRLAVLGVAFLLVFGLAHVLGGGSDGKSDGDGTATTVAGSQTSSAGTSSHRPTKTSTHKPNKSSHTPTPLAEPDGPCSDSEVMVKPVLSSPAAADKVTIRLELTSTDSEACTFTVSPKTVVVKLTSGDDFIWSTQDCPRSVSKADVVVRKTVPAKVDVTWSGRRSNAYCDVTADWALPGWYHAIAAALGGDPTDVPFELGPASAPTVTKTVTPTGQPTHSPTQSPTKSPTRSSSTTSGSPSSSPSSSP